MEIESFENIDNYKIGTGTTESHEDIQIGVVQWQCSVHVRKGHFLQWGFQYVECEGLIFRNLKSKCYIPKILFSIS